MSPKRHSIGRYIKDKTGTKVENRTRSVNITKPQHEFLEKHGINLSLVTRDAIDALIEDKKRSRE